MSSKSAQGQGRRTPLTLNPQGKSVPQQQQLAKQATPETRGKQAIAAQQPAQKPQEKKEAANNAAAASAAGPGPAEKSVSKAQQNVNLKNGLNNGTEPKPTTANTNGNKAATAAVVVEPKKESETRAKPAKPAEEQQQVKNGDDSAAKAAFANNSGNAAQRKQQQKPQTEKVDLNEIIVLAEPEVVVHDKTPTKKVATPKKVENQQEPQKQQTPTVTPQKPAENAAKPSTPKSGGIKRTVTSVIDVEEVKTSPPKFEDKKAVVPLIENPTATSTPGKPIKIEGKGNARTPLAPIGRKSFISGRPSIRASNEWSPSKLGAYRDPNTDLDLSCANTSLNVTVGSEPGNNTSWFSFRSRKRERTPTSIENVQDDVLSPQKRARFGGIFSIMASPFTALRSRFARTAIKQESEEESHEEENNVSMGEEVSMIEIQEDTPATENVNDILPKKEYNDEVDDKTEENKDQIDAPLDASADGAPTERCNMM